MNAWSNSILGQYGFICCNKNSRIKYDVCSADSLRQNYANVKYV